MTEPLSARRHPLSRWLLAATLVGLGVFLYGQTFHCSWALDDIDYLNLTGDFLAGHYGFWRLVLTPHAEHLVPLLRLAVLASVSLFGPMALPYRLAVFATHLGSAWCLSLVARRYAGSEAAAWVTGLAYLLPCGFASTWVWFNTGAGVTIGTLGITVGLAALAYRDRLGVGRARWIAGVGLFLALLSEGTLAPLALSPALLDERERRHHPAEERTSRRRPGGFAVACLAMAAAWLALSAWLYHQTYGPRPAIDIPNGVPRALFLLVTAPFRYLSPGTPLLHGGPHSDDQVIVAVGTGLAVAAAVAALLLALFRSGASPLLRVAGLTAVGPLGMLGLVGIGRAQASYADLYETDRYFFFLTVPLALLAGAVAAEVAGRLQGWPRRNRRQRQLRAAFVAALVLFGCGEALLQRQKLLHIVPFDLYAAHQVRFWQLVILGRDLSAAAHALPPGAPPLLVPDSAVFFPDIHNGRLSTRVLLYVFARHRDPRLRLGGPRVGERDARLLTPALEAWARQIGERPPYLAVVDGKLVNLRLTSFVDFATGPHDEAVVSGFYPREGDRRWMGARGELRLTLTSPLLALRLSTPLDLLHRSNPALRALHLTVTGIDEATGTTIPIGILALDREGVQDYFLDVRPLLVYRGTGRLVRIVLAAESTFHPADVLPGSEDVRTLSLQILRGGFR